MQLVLSKGKFQRIFNLPTSIYSNCASSADNNHDCGDCSDDSLLFGKLSIVHYFWVAHLSAHSHRVFLVYHYINLTNRLCAVSTLGADQKPINFDLSTIKAQILLQLM